MREVAGRIFFAGWIQQDANAGILLLIVAQLQAFGQSIYFLEQKIPILLLHH